MSVSKGNTNLDHAEWSTIPPRQIRVLHTILTAKRDSGAWPSADELIATLYGLAPPQQTQSTKCQALLSFWAAGQTAGHQWSYAEQWLVEDECKLAWIKERLRLAESKHELVELGSLAGKHSQVHVSMSEIRRHIYTTPIEIHYAMARFASRSGDGRGSEIEQFVRQCWSDEEELGWDELARQSDPDSDSSPDDTLFV